MGEELEAFPCAGFGLAGERYLQEGMSLRDWFAGQALPAIIAATSAGQHMPRMQEGESHIRFAIARDAFDMADAMLAARSAAQ